MIARPIEAIREAASPEGIKKLNELIERENAGAVVVGMPVSLSGKHGAQAGETQEFIELLRKNVDIPVEPWDERFTSKLAAQKARGSDSDPHSLAACILLEDYLGSEEFRRRAADEKRGA